LTKETANSGQRVALGGRRTDRRPKHQFQVLVAPVISGAVGLETSGFGQAGPCNRGQRPGSQQRGVRHKRDAPGVELIHDSFLRPQGPGSRLLPQSIVVHKHYHYPAGAGALSSPIATSAMSLMFMRSMWRRWSMSGSFDPTRSPPNPAKQPPQTPSFPYFDPGESKVPRSGGGRKAFDCKGFSWWARAKLETWTR
jgi:hypothetical protein